MNTNYAYVSCIWLVVSIPLKNIRPLGLLIPIYGKKTCSKPPTRSILRCQMIFTVVCGKSRVDITLVESHCQLPSNLMCTAFGYHRLKTSGMNAQLGNRGLRNGLLWALIYVNMLNRYNSPYASDVAERNSLSGSTSNGKRNTRMFLVGESRNVLQPSDARPEDAKQLRYVSHAAYRVSPVKKHLQT